MEAARAMPTYAALLHTGEARLRAAGIETARLDAEVLLATASATDRAGLYARLQAAAPPDVTLRLATLLERRAGREPVAYITGVQEFWSLPFTVTPAVLIPRPETELLVEMARKFLAGATPVAVELTRDSFGSRPPFRRQVGMERAPATATSNTAPMCPPWICDLGTGSGCVAVALARELLAARVVATDISADALAVAAHNAEAHGVADRITYVRGDLFDGLDAALRFDLIVSNPPYLAPGDVVAPELSFEPRTALAAGDDGLAVIRRLIAAAPQRLRPGGWLVMELGCGQGTAVQALAQAAGFAEIAIAPDLAGIPRALVGRRA